MTIQRMDNVLIVVEDLDEVAAFFVELGMELEGKGPPFSISHAARASVSSLPSTRT